MIAKTFLAALALTVLPVAGFATCSAHKEQAQSCAPGSAWDADRQACVDQVSS